MKRFFTLVIVVGACVGVFYLVGLIAPRVQTAESRASLELGPIKLFPVLANVDAWEQWMPGIGHTEERPERNGHPLWLVTDTLGKSWELEVINCAEPHSWSGTYELDDMKCTLHFEIKFLGQGSRLLVTKQRDARSPWVRARRLFRNEQAGLNELLVALGKHLGETVTPSDK